MALMPSSKEAFNSGMPISWSGCGTAGEAGEGEETGKGRSEAFF